MKAIITRRNDDGSFDNVGMNNRRVTKYYRTLRGLLRYAVPNYPCRVELFMGDSIQRESFKTIFTGTINHE